MLGDGVITWQEALEMGDTILFQVPEGFVGAGNPVIHRVVGGDVDGWVTQGDNSGIPDQWSPSSNEVLGVAKFHIPPVGRVLAFMRSWLVIAALAGLAVVMDLWPDPEQSKEDSLVRHGRHLAF